MAGAVLAIAAVLTVRFRRDAGGNAKTAKAVANRQSSSPLPSTTRRQPAAADDPGVAVGAFHQQLAFHPTLKGRRYDAVIRNVVGREDPAIDGWDTEQFSDLAEKQLKGVGNLLSQPDTVDQEQARLLCAPSFQGPALRPQVLKIAFAGPSFGVRRATGKGDDSQHIGLTGFLNAIRQQAAPFVSAAEVRFKFKIFRVNLGNAEATTSAYFQMSGVTSSHLIQVNSTWDCTWEIDNQLESPRLRGISVSDYEEVTSPNRTGALFSDCTEAAFSRSAVLREQFIYGRDHWYQQLEGSIGVEGRGNGIAIGDVNGDGLDDIYFCQPAALPNRLFLRRADGSLDDVSAVAGVDWLDSSRGALLVDIDNDGDQRFGACAQHPRVVSRKRRHGNVPRTINRRYEPTVFHERRRLRPGRGSRSVRVRLQRGYADAPRRHLRQSHAFS